MVLHGKDACCTGLFLLPYRLSGSDSTDIVIVSHSIKRLGEGLKDRRTVPPYWTVEYRHVLTDTGPATPCAAASARVTGLSQQCCITASPVHHHPHPHPHLHSRRKGGLGQQRIDVAESNFDRSMPSLAPAHSPFPLLRCPCAFARPAPRPLPTELSSPPKKSIASAHRPRPPPTTKCPFTPSPSPLLLHPTSSSSAVLAIGRRYGAHSYSHSSYNTRTCPIG